MRRVALAFLAAALLGPVTAFYAVTASGAPAADGKLIATVGPDETIGLTNESGAPVTRLDPGTYEIEIRDRSDLHNFRLSGPGGVNVSTGIEFVGVRTVTVTLVNGEYTFNCDPHVAYMSGKFQVGTGGTTTTQPKPAPKPVKLVATVGPGPTISMTRGGRKVTALKPGQYTITVRDRSRFHNFHLRGPGVNKRTTVRFVGTQTWKLRLRAGVYRFVCTPHARHMKGSFRVR